MRALHGAKGASDRMRCVVVGFALAGVRQRVADLIGRVPLARHCCVSPIGEILHVIPGRMDIGNGFRKIGQISDSNRTGI